MKARLLPFSFVIGLQVALSGCAPTTQPESEPSADPTSSRDDDRSSFFEPESRDLSLADIERLMEELSNWGRWGDDDQLGAANLITPAVRLEALALATDTRFPTAPRVTGDRPVGVAPR